MKANRSFTFRELLVLCTLIGTWLVVTIPLGSYSVLLWAVGILMASVLQPSHQRRATPESVADVLSVAVCGAVICGAIGFVVDLRFSSGAFASFPSWALIGELTGFYLGLVWVLVLLLVRHVERVFGPVNRTRRAT